MPSIQRMILFGSLVAGIPTPRSDGDILVIVDDTARGGGRDRLPDLLRAMSPLPCQVDLFILTKDELDHARREEAPLVREALVHGVDLL